LIGPAPDGARDATQFDIAIAADGMRVVWTELRINVVFGTIDYRRYMARFDGSDVRQVAASGGRPFAGLRRDTDPARGAGGRIPGASGRDDRRPGPLRARSGVRADRHVR